MTSEVFDPTFFIPDVEFSAPSDAVRESPLGSMNPWVVVSNRLLQTATAIAFSGVIAFGPATAAEHSEAGLDYRVLAVTNATRVLGGEEVAARRSKVALRIVAGGGREAQDEEDPDFSPVLPATDDDTYLIE